jgi:hypothetical protein
MDVAQIGKVYAQLDPPVWLVTAADGGRRGGFIATTVAQASIVDLMPRQLITINNWNARRRAGTIPSGGSNGSRENRIRPCNLFRRLGRLWWGRPPDEHRVAA